MLQVNKAPLILSRFSSGFIMKGVLPLKLVGLVLVIALKK